MPINFPISPAVDQTYEYSGRSWKFNGIGWIRTAAGAVTLDGAQTLIDKTLEAVTMTKGYTEEVYALTGTTPVLNPANGSIQTWTLTGASTPTSAINSGQSLTLMIDDVSGYAITWPSVTWKTGAGVAPTLLTTGFTAVQLWKVGAVLYGARVGDN